MFSKFDSTFLKTVSKYCVENKINETWLISGTQNQLSQLFILESKIFLQVYPLIVYSIIDMHLFFIFLTDEIVKGPKKSDTVKS